MRTRMGRTSRSLASKWAEAGAEVEVVAEEAAMISRISWMWLEKLAMAGDRRRRKG